MEVMMWYTWRRYVQNFQKSSPSQEGILLEILKHAKDTVYGQDFSLKDIESVETFRKSRQLTDYKHYEPYVQMALDGRQNVMFPEIVDFIACTSGTTSGKSKMFPKSISFCKGLAMPVFLAMYSCVSRGVPSTRMLKRELWVQSGPKFRTVGKGYRAGPISSTYNPDVPSYVATPAAYRRIHGLIEAVHVHAVFGLSDPHIGLTYFHVAPIAVAFFKYVEEHWQQICCDIEEGRIWDELEISTDVRSDLNKFLKQNPKRAHELRNIFKGGLENLQSKLWPDTQVSITSIAGTFKAQGELLVKRYMGATPVCSAAHGCSEEIYGIQLWEGGLPASFVLQPLSVFFEFIPIQDVDEEQPNTLLVNELTVNEEYEIVITTFEGLYRYRTGDIILITGHYYEMPTYELRGRSGDVFDLFQEKIPATSLTDALVAMASSWEEIHILAHTFAESVELQKVMGDITGILHYVIFIETSDGKTLPEQFIPEVDACFRRAQISYESCRSQGRFEPVQVIQLKRGTFDELRRLLLLSNQYSSAMQLKIPNIVRKEEHLLCLVNGKLSNGTQV